MYLIYLAIFVAGVMLILAAWRYMTATANESRLNRGKDMFKWTLIGLFLVIISFFLIDALLKAFINEARFGPWYPPDCASKV